MRTADQDFTVVGDADPNLVVRPTSGGQDRGVTVRSGAVLGGGRLIFGALPFWIVERHDVLDRRDVFGDPRQCVEVARVAGQDGRFGRGQLNGLL
ncbi:MAG TPA: hypothetical protein VGO30_12565, partial [Mycobacterium sp.]|nr:hypothetical protein [Mycobacterium sp.]